MLPFLLKISSPSFSENSSHTYYIIVYFSAQSCEFQRWTVAAVDNTNEP